MRMLTPLLVTILFAFFGCVGPTDQSTAKTPVSGLQIGDDVIPWNPIHVAGPNKGTNACPICTYEARPAIQIFIKDGPAVAHFSQRLQHLVQQQNKLDLQGFIIVIDSSPEHLKQMATDLHIEDIGLCYPDPQTRTADLKAYKINPTAGNTIVVYKDYKVVANFVDLDAADFDRVEMVVHTLH